MLSVPNGQISGVSSLSKTLGFVPILVICISCKGKFDTISDPDDSPKLSSASVVPTLPTQSGTPSSTPANLPPTTTTVTTSPAPATTTAALPPASCASTPKRFHVAAVRMHSTSFAYPSFQAKLDKAKSAVNSILQKYGKEVDLIVTPEWTFTTSESYEYPDYALDVSCDNNFTNCQLKEGGGTHSPASLLAVKGMIDLAVKNNLTMFLGTIIERVSTATITGIGSPYTFFNTMLIVSPNGTISIRRKISEDWNIPGCKYGAPCHLASAKLANDTLRSIPTTNRCGVTIKSLVTICAEVGYRDLIKNLSAASVTGNDLHIHSERQGDMQFENLTKAIQNGTWSATSFEWTNFGKYFMDSLLTSNVMKQGSHLIVSEGAYSTAGILQLSSTPQPVGNYEYTADYVFGYLP